MTGRLSELAGARTNRGKSKAATAAFGRADVLRGLTSLKSAKVEIQAATFTHLSPDDVAAFQDVVQGRGGVCMSDRKFHAKGGPEENPEGWPDTGILVVYQSVSEGSASQRSDADLTPRNATLYSRNQEWLRTTVEALRTLAESHGPGDGKMQ